MLFKIAKFFLYVSVFAVVIVTTSTLFPFIVGKYTWFRAAVDLALIFFLGGLMFSPESNSYLARLKKLFRSPIVIAITHLFTVIFLLACFFGVRPSFSFWSNFERGEGGFQILTLYIFFILLATLFKEESDWRKVFWASLAAATLMIVYGVIAGTIGSIGSWSFIGPKFGTPSYRFQGSLGNEAYVARLFDIHALFRRVSSAHRQAILPLSEISPAYWGHGDVRRVLHSRRHPWRLPGPHRGRPGGTHLSWVFPPGVAQVADRGGRLRIALVAVALLVAFRNKPRGRALAGQPHSSACPCMSPT